MCSLGRSGLFTSIIWMSKSKYESLVIMEKKGNSAFVLRIFRRHFMPILYNDWCSCVQRKPGNQRPEIIPMIIDNKDSI